MEWHFIMKTLSYDNVPLSDDILEDDTELWRHVKKVMEVIVGLLIHLIHRLVRRLEQRNTLKRK